MAVVEIENLNYSYGSRPALQGVGFAVEEGEIFGLLGPNGGGKTTLFRILSTLLEPDSGRVRVMGWDVREAPSEVRRKIGVVFQSNSLDLQLTVRENLIHEGHLHGLRDGALRARIEEVLGRLALADRRHDLVRDLSGGLRRRLELGKGLLHQPPLLILDEPTFGLDPGVRRDLWKYLGTLRDQEGVTILLTTHIMEEAERCDRLAILSQGRIVAWGTPEALKEKIGGDVIVVQTPEPERLSAEILERFSCPCVVVNGTVRMERSRGHEFVTRLMESFPGWIQAVTVGKPTLEDVFVRETGHRFWEEKDQSS